MILDRPERDHEQLGDLGVRPTVGEKRGDLALARRQRREDRGAPSCRLDDRKDVVVLGVHGQAQSARGEIDQHVASDAPAVLRRERCGGPAQRRAPVVVEDTGHA